MTVSLDLNNHNKYHVNKSYHKYVTGPLDYLVKILGIDCEEKAVKHKSRARNETYFRAPNEKFVELLSIFICKYRQRIKREKLKKARHEEVEETI
jgi:hypothetical protein